MYDVVVLTDARYINPVKKNEYVNNVLLEDQLVLNALKKQNLEAIKLAWTDKDFDWEQTKTVLFRTTWDYAGRFREFSDWLMDVSRKTQLINSYDLILWNLDKHYLRDLADKGVPIIETYFVESEDERSLLEIREELGWQKTVLKPAISAAAKDTYKLENRNDIEALEKRYKELIKGEAMLLQPFQASVMDRGELSLVIIGGHYTHAVLKKGTPGEFRVQDDFGGTVHEYKPTKDEIDLATHAIRACKVQPLYARVDILTDNEGMPAVSELEIIEPELWFRKNHTAAELLASQVKQLFY